MSLPRAQCAHADHDRAVRFASLNRSLAGERALAAIRADGRRILELAPSEVRFEAMRAGGPGGQHQNRTESAVRAVHLPTGLSVVARDERSQHRNRALALRRLHNVLAARDAERRSRKARRDWAERIGVERGNPVRVYQGDPFTRVR